MITKFWRISFIPIGKDIYIYIYIYTHTYIHTYFFSQLELNGSLLLKVVVALFFFLKWLIWRLLWGYELSPGWFSSFLPFSFVLSVFLFPSSLPPFFLSFSFFCSLCSNLFRNKNSALNFGLQCSELTAQAKGETVSEMETAIRWGKSRGRKLGSSESIYQSVVSMLNPTPLSPYVMNKYYILLIF